MEKGELKGIFASGNIPPGVQYKEALGSILQTFPYFQLAQVLFAKQMYDNHEPEASERIKVASVYVPDRKAMYLLFKANDSTQPRSTQVKLNEKGDVKYNFIYNSTTTENIEVQHIPAKNEAIQTEAFIRKELEIGLPVEKLVQVTLAKEETEQSEVKKPLLPPVVEKSKAFNKKKPEEKTSEPPVKEKALGILVKSDIVQVENRKPEATRTVSNNEPITDINLKYSFGLWLKVIPEISVEKKPEIKLVNQKETLNIIDDFLKKAPSISRPKAEFFSPVKAAKMSIAEDDAIVSETLAKIYFTQGNLPKALKTYQTLLLQFPEKKNIFAARIEEIKVLMHENKKYGTK